MHTCKHKLSIQTHIIIFLWFTTTCAVCTVHSPKLSFCKRCIRNMSKLKRKNYGEREFAWRKQWQHCNRQKPKSHILADILVLKFNSPLCSPLGPDDKRVGKNAIINYNARKAEYYRFTDFKMFHKILICSRVGRASVFFYFCCNVNNFWYLHVQKPTLHGYARVNCTNVFLWIKKWQRCASD